MKKQKRINNCSMSIEVQIIATLAVTTTILLGNAKEFKFYKYR